MSAGITKTTAVSLSDVRMFMKDRSTFEYRSSTGTWVHGWLLGEGSPVPTALREQSPRVLRELGAPMVTLMSQAAFAAMWGPVYMLQVDGLPVAFAGPRSMATLEAPLSSSTRRLVNIMAQECVPSVKFVKRGEVTGRG